VLGRATYHVAYDNSILYALEFAAANKFSGIQIAVEAPHLSYENYGPGDRELILKKKTELNLSISLQAPEEVTSLLQPNPRLRDGIMGYYLDLFNFAHDIGAAMTTVHIGQMPIFRTDTKPVHFLSAGDVALYSEAFEDNLKHLLKMAYGKTFVCIENYRIDNVILPIVDRYLRQNNLGLCWDIARTFYSNGKVDKAILDYMTKNRTFIKQVHLHDRNVAGTSYLTLGSGVINFNQYLAILEDIDVWEYCLCTRPREKAAESLQYLKTMLLR
jgi:sugar phosphate isomerase/epimerase